MANKSNKTAICPYSVTKDIKDTSTDIPVAGQRIYIVNQGWCTGDGTTILADLSIETAGANGEVDLSNYYNRDEVDSKISEIDEVGQIYYVDGVAKGEIFNVSSINPNTAVGEYSHSEGYMTRAYGERSHTEGDACQTGIEGKNNGKAAHSEGYMTYAIGNYAHSEGYNTQANGEGSHSEGTISPFTSKKTLAIGNGSHAEGNGTSAQGIGSHSEGLETIADCDYQHVQGKFNITDTEKRYAHIVGNGEYSPLLPNGYRKSNAHTLDWYGNAWFAGEVYVGGTNQDEGSKLANLNEVFDSANNALDARIISSDIISDNPYEEGLMSDENYESLSEFNTFSSLSTMAIYDFLQGQINNDCVNYSTFEDTKTEINETLANKVGVDNFENFGYSRTDAENTFQSKDYIIDAMMADGNYIINGMSIGATYITDVSYEQIAEEYNSGRTIYLIIQANEDMPYSVKLTLTKQSDLSGDLIFESACGITATMNSENVFTFDTTNPFIKQKVFDDTINTLIQRIEALEAQLNNTTE